MVLIEEVAVLAIAVDEEISAVRKDGESLDLSELEILKRRYFFMKIIKKDKTFK